MAEVGIIGAGVAGLSAAYRLRQQGHRVTVLEAKPQAGGLSTTARWGDVLVERDARGEMVHQTVNLDPGLHVNAGPGRLPHHHRRILNLCSRLGVNLEPYIMTSDANYFVDARSGERFRRRRIEHDMRGWVAELAYSTQDPARLRELVTAFGDLSDDGRYVGTPRAGDGDPIPLSRLSELRCWAHRFQQPITHQWQPVMFEPVGGMDQVWRAMLDHVHDAVVYNAPVDSITSDHRGRSVEVAWQRHGQRTSRRFDWFLSSAPFPVVSAMTLGGFDRAYRAAIDTPQFAPACKVGWQAETRFWESDQEQIYGGISYTNDPIQQFWYPSTGQLTDTPATLTGAYAAYEAAEMLGRLPIDRRIARARRGGARIHPEVGDEDLVPTSKALTVAWHRVPYQAGGWAHWDPRDPTHKQAFQMLTAPCGRFLPIGDQISSYPGWQEGCLESVDRAVAWIDGDRADREAATPEAVPDSRALTVGDHPSAEVAYEEGDPQ